MVCHHTSVGSFAAFRLLRGDQSRRHVRLPVDRRRVEVVSAGGFHVHQDRVVLGRPLVLRLGTVVVGPDDLVEEALPPEECVEQHLRVVRLPVIQVQIQRAVRREQPPGFGEPRFEKRPVVVERVVVAHQVTADALVLLTFESLHRAGRRTHARGGLAGLDAPSIEGRIEVDHRERGIRQGRYDGEIVALNHPVRRGCRPGLGHGPLSRMPNRRPSHGVTRPSQRE